MKQLQDIEIIATGNSREISLSNRRYISHCANKGLDNFYVTYSLVKELIEVEIEKRGQITENTIKV